MDLGGILFVNSGLSAARTIPSLKATVNEVCSTSIVIQLILGTFQTVIVFVSVLNVFLAMLKSHGFYYRAKIV